MFNGASGFKQGIWCNSIWQSAPVAAASLPAGNAVFCCSPGNYFLGQTAWTATVADQASKEDCIVCPTGRYADTINLQIACPSCPRDFITLTAGLSKCGKCPPAKFSSDGENCEICGAGTFTSIGIIETHCEPCGAGLYQELSGNNTCLHCPAGWNQGEKGKPFCFPCVPGTLKFVLLLYCCCFHCSTCSQQFSQKPTLFSII